MIKNKIITYISFAKKSRSLCIGFNATKKSILLKKAHIIILLYDVSDKTKKEITRICKINDLKFIVLPIKSEELEHIFNKKVVVMSLLNKNLSSEILKIM